jgi:hypothetical protein
MDTTRVIATREAIEKLQESWIRRQSFELTALNGRNQESNEATDIIAAR